MCKRVPHPRHSPDLAIADVYLCRVLKQKLQGIDESDDEELKGEILRIFQGIPSDQPKTSFDHWIERGPWLPPRHGTIIHHSHKAQYLFYPCPSHKCRDQKPIGHPIPRAGSPGTFSLSPECEGSLRCNQRAFRVFESTSLL
jgi:hypothetical protein